MVCYSIIINYFKHYMYEHQLQTYNMALQPGAGQAIRTCFEQVYINYIYDVICSDHVVECLTLHKAINA